MKERRKSHRERTDWLAEVYTDDIIYTSPVRNLSLGGAELIRSPLWKAKQDHICKICFSDKVPSHTIEVRMKVCWVTKDHVGLKFQGLSFKQKIILDKLISSITKAVAFESGYW